MIIIIEKDVTSSCNNKKTRLIFDNVTKQLRFKNSARSMNAFLSYYNHYIRSLLLLLFEYILLTPFIKYYFKVSSFLLHSLNFFVYLLFTIILN